MRSDKIRAMATLYGCAIMGWGYFATANIRLFFELGKEKTKKMQNEACFLFFWFSGRHKVPTI